MKFSLLIITFTFGLFACKNEAGNQGTDAVLNKPLPATTADSTANGGFIFYHFIKNDGQTPKPGDVVMYYADIKKGKELLTTTRTLNRPKDFTFPKEYTGSPQPLIEGLRLMSKGDSATVIYKLGPDSSEWMFYELKVVDIQPGSN